MPILYTFGKTKHLGFRFLWLLFFLNNFDVEVFEVRNVLELFSINHAGSCNLFPLSVEREHHCLLIDARQPHTLWDCDSDLGVDVGLPVLWLDNLDSRLLRLGWLPEFDGERDAVALAELVPGVMFHKKEKAVCHLEQLGVDRGGKRL